jgi:hypothetical protein
MWVAKSDSRNFQFEAYGTTKAKALAALKQGFIRHAIVYDCDPDWVDDMDLNNVYKIEANRAYRDCERLDTHLNPIGEQNAS